MRTVLKAGIIGLALSASTMGIASYGHDTSSDEEQVTKTYDFKDFDKIAIGGVYEVDVTVGPAHKISLSGDAKKMARVDVYSEDGILHLDTEKDKKGRKSNHDGEGITVTITLPSLEALRISGVASGDVTGVKADEFDLRVSGVAEVSLEGSCNELDARVTGVGELNAREFKCKDVDASLTGVGEMSVYASESVDVSATGVGEVNVYGNPKKVIKNKAFFSQVNIK